MVKKFRISGELHHLRVDEYKFQFRRVLRIKQRRYQHVQSHRLALFRRTSHKKMRRLRQVEHLHFLGQCRITYGYRQFRLAVAELVIVQHGLQRHYRSGIIRHLNADGVTQLHHTYLSGIQCHGNFLVETFDCRDLHAACREYLI